MNPVDTCIAPIFVPAHRPDLFAKAAASGADAIILDLEDGVPVDAKVAARLALKTNFTEKPVIVRINGVGTPWHTGDVAAVEALKPIAVMLPKTESAIDVVEIARRFSVVGLIETARGIANTRALATSGAVRRLAFGSVDLAADLGCNHSREALAFARGEFVLASGLGRLPRPLDGVTTGFADAASAADDAHHARALGFGGKMVIHPKQVSVVLAAFQPSDEELAWAMRVVASGDGVVAIDNIMVDEPVRIKARSLLLRSAAATKLSPWAGVDVAKAETAG
jgi:citrate lyase subunit beta / citryl-CoA lyase